jgi:hypothetical protein
METHCVRPSLHFTSSRSLYEHIIAGLEIMIIAERASQQLFLHTLELYGVSGLHQMDACYSRLLMTRQ